MLCKQRGISSILISSTNTGQWRKATLAASNPVDRGFDSLLADQYAGLARNG